MELANPDFDDFDPLRWQFAALEFWAEPSEWPPDSAEHVFLARVVCTLGRMAYPDHWDDFDTVRRFTPMFVEDTPVALRGPEQGYALRLLQEFRADLNIDADRVERLSHEPLTIDEWKAAFDAFDTHQRELRIQALKRVQVVSLWMSRLFAAGHLQASARELIGDGQFRPVAVEDWNRDGLEGRFAFCLISRAMPPDDTDSLAPPSFWKATPNDLVSRSSWPQYLFVSRSSLSSLLNPTNGKRSPQLQVGEGNVVEFLSASNRAKSAKLLKKNETDEDKRGRLAEAITFLETHNREWIATDMGSGRFSHDDWTTFAQDKNGPLKLTWRDAVWVWNKANLTDSYRGTPGR